jgi:D-cysteine desulfhydrase
MPRPTPPADLPFERLFDDPSPLHRLPRFAAALGGGIDVWVKREDLLPIGLGGNKLRNLEVLIAAALAEGADTLVTSGRRWSNHARLTAAAGARCGLDVHLVLSGPPAIGGPNPSVRLDELFGATVHQAASADRAERDVLVASVVADLRAGSRRPYVIDVGGSGVLGATGQWLAGVEALEQATLVGLRPDVVVLPSATGGTQAGLITAMAAADPVPRVVGVVVARPAAVLQPAIAALVDGLGGSGPIELDESQLGAGYGRQTVAAEEATRLLARTEGILVDPIYTAKALAWLVAAARAGELDGQTVLFWHAGGIPGLFEPLD